MNIKNILLTAILVLISLFIFNFFNKSESNYKNQIEISLKYITDRAKDLIVLFNNKKTLLEYNKNNNDTPVDRSNNTSSVDDSKKITSKCIGDINAMLQEYSSLSAEILPIDDIGLYNNIELNLFNKRLINSEYLKKNKDIWFSLSTFIREIIASKESFKIIYNKDKIIKEAQKTLLDSEQDFITKQKLRTHNINNEFNAAKVNLKNKLNSNLKKLNLIANNRKDTEIPSTDSFYIATSDLLQSAIKSKWIIDNSVDLMIQVESFSAGTLIGKELRLANTQAKVSYLTSVGGGSGGGAVIYETSNKTITITGVPDNLKLPTRCSIKAYPDKESKNGTINNYVFIKKILSSHL
jgi:hypothetical protein